MRIFSWTLPGALLVSFLIAPGLKAQQLPPPIQFSGPHSLLYSSPYGPRHMFGGDNCIPDCYQFHLGVDYRYGLGIPYYAVEGGTITNIHLDTVNNWLITIQGSHKFQYIHMFDNSWMGVGDLPTDDEGRLIYGQACLNSKAPPVTDGVSDSSCGTYLITLEETICPDEYMIVFWHDFDKGIADKVLSACDFSGFLLNTVGGVEPANKVSQGDLIGFVGHSGSAATAGPHLHLQVDLGKENPLLFVQHDNSDPPGFGVSVYKDSGTTIAELDSSTNKVFLQGGEVLNPETDIPLRIRTEVNYSNVGHDLDVVGIAMFKKNDPVPMVCGGGGGVTTSCFDYGGSPVQPFGSAPRTVFPFATWVPGQPRSEPMGTAVLQQGVYPHPLVGTTGSGGGVVDFLSKQIDLTQIDPGPYLISVGTLDVLGEEFDHVPVEVEVPPKLTVSVVGNGSVFSTPGGLNSGIDCGTGVATPVCSDWFDIKKGVSLTAMPASDAVQFEGWSGDCDGTGETTTVFVASSTPESKECTATFTKPDFTGQWNTTYGFMILSQNGNAVTGSYAGGFNGTVMGTVTTGADGVMTLSARWSDNTGTGSLKFILASDGERFVGTWVRFTGIGNSGGQWNGIRDQGPTFSGTWSTSFGAMSLVVNGTTVTGFYDVGGFNGSITGTVSNLTFLGFWSDNTGTGSLIFQLTGDNQNFNGTWVRFTGTGSPGGEWDGTRAP